MKEHPRETEPSRFLSGWKEIANYLGKGVRTAQRYERHLGLPVRRPAGKSSGSVVAVPAELDGWVKASPIREAFPLQNSDLDKGNAASRQAIKEGIAEMTRLRDQMSQLRRELRGTVEELRHSLFELHGELNQNYLQESTSWLTPLENQLLRHSESDRIPPSKRYPKAS